MVKQLILPIPSFNPNIPPVGIVAPVATAPAKTGGRKKESNKRKTTVTGYDRSS